jgi:hypothetical protein
MLIVADAADHLELTIVYSEVTIDWPAASHNKPKQNDNDKEEVRTNSTDENSDSRCIIHVASLSTAPRPP